MKLTLVTAALLTAATAWAQAPSGRWVGKISIGALRVPFTMHFEGAGPELTGSFMNGDTRVTSTSGSFQDGSLRLIFQSGTRLEATFADGELKGVYGDAKSGMNSFKASAYCTCSYEGEAGPDIAGTWDLPGAGWRLIVLRKGEDTLATLIRDGRELGPLTGRFDGAVFTLNYFDGTRAAVLEIEPRKEGGLDTDFREPGAGIKKDKAVRAASQN